jgi:tetratricopeptide (TPR) repeat protein
MSDSPTPAPILVPTPIPQKHFLRQLFEEGMRNVIRLFVGLLVFLVAYLFLSRSYKNDPRVFFSCDVAAAAQNIGSEAYFSSSIYQGIEHIIEGNRQASSRHFANAATSEPFIKNEMYSFEIYQKWSLSKLLHSVGLVNKYINCSISADTSGYACTLNMTNKKNTEESSKHVKFLSKHLDVLFTLCAEHIVEYYEPSLLPAYFFSEYRLDEAERAVEKLLRTPGLLTLTFGGREIRDKMFWINQIYVNIMLDKNRKILRQGVRFNGGVEARLRKILSDIGSSAQKSNSKIDLATYHFLQGAYLSRCLRNDSSVIQFAKAVEVLETLPESDTTQLTLARTLNNYAYILYKINRVGEAAPRIAQALDILQALRSSPSNLQALDQVYGLCKSTECEILWTQSGKAKIEEIRASLIEAKHFDRTFLFNRELIETDPIYRDILREAKKSVIWRDFIRSQMKDAEEQREFLSI